MNAPVNPPLVEGRIVRLAMGIILAMMLVLVFLALSGATVTAPPEWLTKWTQWILSAVGAVIAPNVLAAAATGLRNLGRR